MLSRAANGHIKGIYWLIAIVITLAIGLVYGTVFHAQFIWDDILDFQKMAWLRHGNDWQHLLLQRFNDWVAYFRPLVVALFTVEVRVFGANPSPMHLVSLLIHLINTLLVGTLALRLSAGRLPQNKRVFAFALSMLLYGLHPVLIEPVVWIGCQFELVATLFMLLGWLSSMSIKRPVLRAISVGICFFLAACAKESAIAFLPILIVFDWFALDVSRDEAKRIQLRKLLIQNAPVYGGILLAGIAYLALRHLSLGSLIPGTAGKVLPLWGRLQEASFLYLRYWRMFFWPTVDMGPVHPVDIDQFLMLNAWALWRDAMALGAVIAGIVLTIRRSYTGALVLCVTFALFPVLHIIATNFDRSLYHERYALTALAVACAWLPSVLSEIPTPATIRRTLSLVAYLGLAAWVALSVMSIRVTIPLWSTQVSLWQWALQQNPDFIDAKDQLISGYIDAGDDGNAWRLINSLGPDGISCTSCMLNAANLSLHENNPQRADTFLQKIKNSPDLYADPTSFRVYLTTIGALKLMEGKAAIAEQIERRAMANDRSDPAPQLVLVQTLAFQGKTEQAMQAESSVLALLNTDERESQYQRFEHLLKYIHDHPEKSDEAASPYR